MFKFILFIVLLTSLFFTIEKEHKNDVNYGEYDVNYGEYDVKFNEYAKYDDGDSINLQYLNNNFDQITGDK